MSHIEAISSWSLTAGTAGDSQGVLECNGVSPERPLPDTKQPQLLERCVFYIFHLCKEVPCPRVAALLLGPCSPQAIPPHIPSASILSRGRGPAGGRGAGPAGGAARGSRRKRRCRGGARRARGAAMPGRKSSKEKKRRRSRSCCPEGAPGPDGSDRKRRSTESSHGALEVARA